MGNKPASDLGGENFAVVKGNNVDEAVTFLKFVASPAEMKTYINSFGYIASRKDVAATQFTSDPLNDPINKVFVHAAGHRPAARSASALARDLRRASPWR